MLNYEEELKKFKPSLDVDGTERGRNGFLCGISVSDRRDQSVPQGGEDMLNYEEELKKFKPSLDVDEVENAIYNQDLTDVIDLMKDLVRPGHKPMRTEGKEYE